MIGVRRENHGRNAAEDNRQALLAAAAEVFGEHGLDAPLSAVVKKAGVGQGSLYRHFPDRLSLALAMFESNVAEIESLAAQPSSTLDDLLALITTQTIRCIALVDIVAPGLGDPRMAAVTERVRAALTQALDRARESGAVQALLGVDDLMLAIGMVAALVARTPAGARRQTAERAWTVLRRGLHP